MLQHIPELDGVRGIAILAVMVMHFYIPAAVARPYGMLTRVIQQGTAGVDLFFVLSGFLITGILVSSRSALNYFQSFYVRRAVRILPLYVAVTAGFFWVAVPLIQRHGKDLWIKPHEQIWYWLFLANWRHAFRYNNGAQLAHFWSLAIEEQFYAIWPFVVWRSSRRTLERLSAALVVAVIILRTYLAAKGWSHDFIVSSTITRLDELALGALISLSESFRKVLVRFAWLVLPVAVTGSLMNLPLELTLVMWTAGSGAVVALATTRAVPLLRIGWLRALGKYSYGLYVLHYMVYSAIAPSAPRFRPLPFALCSILGGIPLSLLAAWLSWNLLEKRFLSLKRYVPYRFASRQHTSAPSTQGVAEERLA